VYKYLSLTPETVEFKGRITEIIRQRIPDRRTVCGVVPSVPKQDKQKTHAEPMQPRPPASGDTRLGSVKLHLRHKRTETNGQKPGNEFGAF